MKWSLRLGVVGGFLSGCMGVPQANVAVDEARGAAQPIINGEACTAEDFPSAVAVLADGALSIGGLQLPIKTVMCTGTLIAPDVVLTAAHCVDPTALSGGFGTVDNVTFYVTSEPDLTQLAQQMTQEFPPDAIAATEVLKHPEFTLEALTPETVNGPGNFKDIGLMFLSRPMARLPMHVVTDEEAAGLVVGAAVDIAGWGQQQPGSGNILEPPPPGTVGRKICARTSINEMGTHEMQIGSDIESKRKCHGDSGGPSYLEVDVGGETQLRVVGVTSHAYDAEDCNKGGVDTRVDVWRSWIDTEMRDRCTSGTRVWCDTPGIPPADYEFPVIVDDRDAGTPEADAGSMEEADAGQADVDAGSTTGEAPDAGKATGSAGDAPKPSVTPGGCAHAAPSTVKWPVWAMLLAVVGASRRKRG